MDPIKTLTPVEDSRTPEQCVEAFVRNATSEFERSVRDEILRLRKEVAEWRSQNPSDDLWRVRAEQAEAARDAAESLLRESRRALTQACIEAIGSEGPESIEHAIPRLITAYDAMRERAKQAEASSNAAHEHGLHMGSLALAESRRADEAEADAEADARRANLAQAELDEWRSGRRCLSESEARPRYNPREGTLVKIAAAKASLGDLETGLAAELQHIAGELDRCRAALTHAVSERDDWKGRYLETIAQTPGAR